MARTFVERWRQTPGGEVLNLVAHVFLLGAAPLEIFAGFETWGFAGWEIVGGAVAALPMTVDREFVRGLPIESWGDAVFDTVQLISGGALGGFLYGVIRAGG